MPMDLKRLLTPPTPVRAVTRAPREGEPPVSPPPVAAAQGEQDSSPPGPGSVVPLGKE